jgi:hypothetical protein
VIINGYYYNLHKKNVDTKLYRCRKQSGCSSSVTIYDDVTIVDRIKRINEIHNHTPTNPEDVQLVKDMINDMKLTAELEDKPLQEIYENALMEYKQRVCGDEDRIKLFPEFKSIKSCLYGHQKKKYPNLPISCEEIDLKDEFVKTIDGTQFMISDPNDVHRCIVFASETGLKILGEYDRYGADGTFYASPKFYSQMYTIHAYYKGCMLPCVFIIMNGNSEEDYKKVISCVKTAATRLRIKLRQLFFSLLKKNKKLQ